MLSSHFFCIQSVAIWKKAGFTQIYSWKREDNFNGIKLDNCGFLDNYDYSSLTLHQNATSGSYLKVSYKTKKMLLAFGIWNRINELFYSVHKIPWSILYFEWMALLPINDCATSCIGHTENTGSLSYTDFPNVDTCHYSIYFLKVTFANITNDLIRKLFKCVKLPCSKWQIQVFQNPTIHLKAHTLPLAPYSQLFSLRCQLSSSFSRNIHQIPKSEYPVNLSFNLK